MVIKNLKVALTASQRRRIKSAWRKHGKDGFAILCQVPLYYGPLAVRNPKLEVAILDAATTQRVAAALVDKPDTAPAVAAALVDKPDTAPAVAA